MGASFILLGIILFMSQWRGIEVYTLLLSWWPFILIVLGVEMLVYLGLAKEEGRIKYDFLSIFFVGILGTLALSFMLLSVSGLLEEFSDVLREEEYTLDLPMLNEQVPQGIERIIVEAQNHPLTIETSEEQFIQAFGTYQIYKGDQELPSFNDYVNYHSSGSILYVTFKRLPTKTGVFPYQMQMKPTFIVPNDIDLEVRAKSMHEDLRLYPRKLEAKWMVDTGANVVTFLEQESDILIKADHLFENDQEHAEDELTIGDGTYPLDILTNSKVDVKLINW
jgi:hypothetical protein